jgi:hypothetical protein
LRPGSTRSWLSLLLGLTNRRNGHHRVPLLVEAGGYIEIEGRRSKQDTNQGQIVRRNGALPERLSVLVASIPGLGCGSAPPWREPSALVPTLPRCPPSCQTLPRDNIVISVPPWPCGPPAIAEGTERLVTLRKCYDQVRGSFPTWPVEISTASKLGLAVFLPLLTSLVPAVIYLVTKTAK